MKKRETRQNRREKVMEEMKMKGYKEERQRGRRDKKKSGWKKQRKETVPPTCISTGKVSGITCIWQLLGLVVKGHGWHQVSQLSLWLHEQA